MGANQSSTSDQSPKSLVGPVHTPDPPHGKKEKAKSHSSSSSTSRKGVDAGSADTVLKSKARANDSGGPVRTKAQHSRQSSIIVEETDIAEPLTPPPVPSPAKPPPPPQTERRSPAPPPQQQQQQPTLQQQQQQIQLQQQQQQLQQQQQKQQQFQQQQQQQQQQQAREQQQPRPSQYQQPPAPQQQRQSVEFPPLHASPPQQPYQGSIESPRGQRQPIKIDVLGEQSDGRGLAAALPAIIMIPPEAMCWVSVFGESTVRYLFSGDWKEREQALAGIIRQLGDRKFQNSREPGLVFATAMQLLAGTLREKIVPVYLTALELFNTVMATYSSRLRADVLHFAAEPLVKQLVHRCGNNNSRISECSLQALLQLASQPNFGVGYLGPFALAPIIKKAADGTSANAQMVGRLELIHALLATFNSTRGLSLQDVQLFTRSALDLPDDRVRGAAIAVVAELYRLKRMAGDVLDPQKALGQLKPSLLQVLQRKFDEVDELLRTGGIAPAWGNSGSYDGRPIDEFPATANSVRIFTKPLAPIPKIRANPLSLLSLGGVGPIGGYNNGGNVGSYASATSHASLHNISSSSYQNGVYTNGNGNGNSHGMVHFLTNANPNEETSPNDARHPSPSRVKFPRSSSIKGRSVIGEVSLPSVALPRKTVGDSPVRGLGQSTNHFNVNSEDSTHLYASMDSISPGYGLPKKTRSVKKFRDSQSSIDHLRVSYAGSTVLDDTDEGLIEYILNDETLLI